jgi:hypothetical protein
MFVVSDTIESPWQCGGCESDAINGTFGEQQTFACTDNAIDWTPDAETEAMYNEFPETDRTDELIADLRTQLEIAQADLDDLEKAHGRLITQYKNSQEGFRYWFYRARNAEMTPPTWRDRLADWVKRQWEADIYADR